MLREVRYCGEIYALGDVPTLGRALRDFRKDLASDFASGLSPTRPPAIGEDVLVREFSKAMVPSDWRSVPMP